MAKPADAVPIRAAQYIRTSSDDQRYSPEVQDETNRGYAADHGMEVVRTYVDRGISGLRLNKRDGLKALLNDVSSLRVDFSVVLVYDVTRWGRFQNIDESAYYDFLCRTSGVRVIYCMESFEAHESVMGSVLKDLRRISAGEFSRNLSVKTWQGHCTITRKGFLAVGRPNYGLRRYLIDAQGRPKCPLKPGEHKGIATDRIILIPGPPEEVEIVWKIFDTYAQTELSIKNIADLLNGEGAPSPDGGPWNWHSIHRILMSPRYVGCNLYNKTSAKLRGKSVSNPPEQWIRCEGAFRPLITQALFERAQTKWLSVKRVFKSKEDLKLELRQLLERHGYLSASLIYRSPGPSLATYHKAFGNLTRAYAAVGYCSLRKSSDQQHRQTVDHIRRRLADELPAALSPLECRLNQDRFHPILLVGNRFRLLLGVGGSYFNRSKGGFVWAIPRCPAFDYFLFAGLDLRNQDISRYFLIPGSEAPLPSAMISPSPRFSPYRVTSLGQVKKALTAALRKS